MRGAIVVALLAVAGTAHAQSAKAAAQAAFAKAKQLMAAGDLATACATFEQSEMLDPQLGTQYNLALCYEKDGKLTSAWINFSEVAAKDAKGGRKDDSAARVKALEPRLSKVVITIDAPVAGETVRIGKLDVSVLAGSAQPIDEGSYNVIAIAADHVEWTGHIEVRGEGTTVALEVPALAKIDLPPPVESNAGHGRRVGGVVLAGAGVVAIGVGLFFGKEVIDLQGEAEDACGGQVAPCNGDLDRARALTDDANGKATIADIAVGGGAALVIAGVILYKTAPHETHLSPLIAPDRVGLSFAAHW